MSDSQISDVKQKTDIVTIIGERVKLSKAGKHFKGLCPFHSERSSSFIVSPELQIFKCFGCGESGDVFSFLQKYEGMEFGEALRYLADRAGIVLQKVHTTGQKDIYFEINELASKFYHYLLTTHPSGKQALLYLQKERGLTIETIEAFQLGFAPVGTPVLYRYLTGKKHYDPQVLVKSGVISNYGGRYFDRFRGRIVFPIFTPYGKCVALAGRILPHYATKKEIPKYINSPETDIYHKSSSLYGFYQTRGDIKRTGEAIIVEGEMDLLSSWQVGVRNVVAIKGSSLTQEQATLLSRVCQKLIIALDSDFAGNAAAVRGIGITAALGLDIRVANFLPYKDPDEAARGDLSLYKDRLATSSGIWDFLLDSIFHKYSDEDSGTSTAKLSRELIPILAAIEDSVVRAHYIQFVSKRLDVPHEAVSEQLQRFLKTHEVVSSKPALENLFLS
jgi:DNA primase